MINTNSIPKIQTNTAEYLGVCSGCNCKNNHISKDNHLCPECDKDDDSDIAPKKPQGFNYNQMFYSQQQYDI